MTNNIISLNERLEKWKRIYTSQCGTFHVVVSSRGFLKVIFEDDQKKPILLDFFESVRFMSEVSKGFEDMVMDAI